MDTDFDMNVALGAHAHFQGYQSAPPTSTWSDDGNRKQLDLVFIQDCTGSQGSYINSATKNIEDISRAIFESGKLIHPDDLRLGLIAFRDHPPQDHTYVTKNFGFTSDISRMRENLRTLFASGGGDGPEAVTAALAEALDMQWRPNATKMVVLIADAPPHGIGEHGDGFPEGSPCGRDPLQIARTMASRGIVLFFVACEPALSGYCYANDFYQAITQITSGVMLPLTNANLLAHAIVGSVLENLDMERLIREVGYAVAEKIHLNNESVDDVARELHEKLLLRNESTKHIVIENIYRDIPEAAHNVQVWLAAASVQEARPQLKRISGTRFSEKYLAQRYMPSSRHIPSSPRSTTPLASSVSGSPRKAITTDAKVFGGLQSSNLSISGTAVQKSTFSLAGNKAAFSAMRGAGRSRMDDDEEDDEENGHFRTASSDGQTIQLKEDAISFDQARRIAMQSAWRTARV